MAPIGGARDLYATCQYSTLEEAIRVRATKAEAITVSCAGVFFRRYYCNT